MAAPASIPPFRLNIEESLRSLARDPAWPRKLGLGIIWSLLSFTIVGAFFVQGYMLLLLERVARAEPLPLPEWEDYGGLLRRGWRVFVTNLVYQLPLIVLWIILGVASFGLIVAFIGTIRHSGGSRGANPLLFSPFLLLLIIPIGLLLALLGFLIGLIIPAAQAQLVLHDRLGAAFDLGAVLAFIRRNLGQYAIAVALSIGAGLLLDGLSAGTRFTFNFNGVVGGTSGWNRPSSSRSSSPCSSSRCARSPLSSYNSASSISSANFAGTILRSRRGGSMGAEHGRQADSTVRAR